MVYIILAVEAVAIIFVSSVWKVVSFKHTHLVERAGLLTLIVIGEGILGLTKAVAYVLVGVDIPVWAELGLVSSAIYLIVSVWSRISWNIANINVVLHFSSLLR